MNFDTACKILEIEDVCNISVDQLKKKYHMLALKHHPDKNNNSIASTQQFQLICEAYEYMMTNLFFENKQTNSENTGSEPMGSENTNYVYLVSLFISGFVKGVPIKLIMKIMNIIFSGWAEFSLHLFDEMNKEKSIEFYNFICKYKHVLHIPDDIIQKIQNELLNKFNRDKVFILNPSITDLLEHNIYKLVVDNNLYIVPLWHNELYFDNNGDDIIVLCIPELSNYINIDENNNIVIEINTSWNILIKEKKIIFLLGKKEYIIPAEKLYIKSIQTFILKRQGISIDDDIYNISNKSDIIVKIYIADDL